MTHSFFAILEGLSGMELVTVSIVALILFGGKRMPSLARTAGRTVREFRKITGEFEREFKRAVDEASVDDEAAPRPPPLRARRESTEPSARPVHRSVEQPEDKQPDSGLNSGPRQGS